MLAKTLTWYKKGEDMDDMMREVDTYMKVSYSEAVNPLHSELHDLKSRVGALESAGLSIGSGQDADMTQKV